MLIFTFQGLPPEEHVILVDLPGHGGSWIAADEDFDFDPLARRVKKVREGREWLN